MMTESWQAGVPDKRKCLSSVIAGEGLGAGVIGVFQVFGLADMQNMPVPHLKNVLIKFLQTRTQQIMTNKGSSSVSTDVGTWQEEMFKILETAEALAGYLDWPKRLLA